MAASYRGRILFALSRVNWPIWGERRSGVCLVLTGGMGQAAWQGY